MDDAANAFLSGIDVFCKVIDHLGDAGTAWRLCRELRLLLGGHCRLRLFIDRVDVLEALSGGEDAGGREASDPAVEVLAWTDDEWERRGLEPASVLIEMFGCTLPESVLQAPPDSPRLIVNLEYFSCEDWALDCHLKESFVDVLGFGKYFFIPGLDPQSGGIMSLSRPLSLDAERFQLRTQWLNDTVHMPELAAMDWIALYTYENRFDGLLEHLSASEKPSVVWVMGKESQDEMRRLCSKGHVPRDASSPIRFGRGGCTLVLPEIMPQKEFDRLLSLADFLLIRGEDSLAGALTAGTPFLWQLYPQQDDAHLVKMKAFLSTLDALWGSDADRLVFRQAMQAFNCPELGGEVDWQMFFSRREAMKSALGAYARTLRETCNLSKKLLRLISLFFQGEVR